MSSCQSMSNSVGLAPLDPPYRTLRAFSVPATLCAALLWLGVLPTRAPAEEPVAIVVGAKPDSAIKLAADDVARILAKVYPQVKFAVRAEAPREGRLLVIGLADEAHVKPWLGRGRPKASEGYVLDADERNGREVVLVLGADVRGAVYGCYAFLERLNCGFYLSYDALPAENDEIVLDLHNQGDEPLMKERIVFNWHNFLSGCSTWNLDHWKHWTDQSLKMGFNSIMVHAYGNNPMFAYEFGGQQKPVGFLSTTVKGRDWSTQHVNDVRRLYGGQVFGEPVFGPAAGLVPDERRVAAARELMQGAFRHARQRGMDVYFAVDVDTPSANPQALIATLPESARFPINSGATWLANPDTPEGYKFYKAQVDALLGDYPEITTVVVWFRRDATPWSGLKLEDLPPAWKQQFEAEVAKDPAVAKLWHGPGLFGICRIVAAYERAIAERGRKDLSLAIGSWNFDFLPACDRFLPPHVKFIPLDYDVLHEKSNLDTEERRAPIRAVGKRRPMIPVVWAHHDDGHYIGRPYSPFEQFQSKLTDCGASGYGIIHWTTRPLDIYFKSLSKQVWRKTKDQRVRVTGREMAARSFGADTDYLLRWLNEAPRFGRETSDFFIDRVLPDWEEVARGCNDRRQFLGDIDRAALTKEQCGRIEYYRGLEDFTARFFQAQDAYRQAETALKAGDRAKARDVLALARPEDVIELFAKNAKAAGITRGEEGLVVSMNLRWLSHHIRLRQTLGMEPARYCFGSTSHDPLAQSAGTFTFHVDSKKNFWQRLGTRECGAATYTVADDVKLVRDELIAWPYEEVCRAGVEIDKPLMLNLMPIMDRDGRRGPKGSSLPAGRYRVELIMADTTSTAAGQREFKVALASGVSGPFEAYRFPATKAKFLRIACRGNSKNPWNSICEARLPTLKKGAAVKASDALGDYAAAKAIDGKLDTRWAIEGDDHWIEFPLDAEKETGSIEIAWYRPDSREPKFDILLSTDGRDWKKADVQQETIPTKAAEVTIDPFQMAGRANGVVVKSLETTLDRPGVLTLTITPIKGQAILSGVIVEPLAASPAEGQTLLRPEDPQAFEPARIRQLLLRVNDYQRSHPWRESDNGWIRATYYAGVMAAHEATREPKLFQQAYDWAKHHEWQPATRETGGNALTCCQTYTKLSRLLGNAHNGAKDNLDQTIQWLDSGKPKTPTGEKLWYFEDGRRYADGLFTGPPALAMLGEYTGDKKYFAWMDAFFWDVHAELFDADAGLFYRDKRFKDVRNEAGKKVIWARGNGWVFAGLTRIIPYLPKDHPTRDKYSELFRQLAAALAKCQGDDGLWRMNLADPGEFPNPESSGTGFFCYGLAWGVNNGVLDRPTYEPVARRAWSGLCRCVSDEGKVEWGQLVGDRPKNLAREHSHEYVTGTFLLAGSEMLRLVEKK